VWECDDGNCVGGGLLVHCVGGVLLVQAVTSEDQKLDLSSLASSIQTLGLSVSPANYQ
jgi:hypothetical protein